MTRSWLLAPLLLATAPAFATCYTVYSGSKLVYQSTRSPVDLAYPLHDTLSARFGRDATMIFVPDSSECSALANAVNSLVVFQLPPAAAAAKSAGRSSAAGGEVGSAMARQIERSGGAATSRRSTTSR